MSTPGTAWPPTCLCTSPERMSADATRARRIATRTRGAGRIATMVDTWAKCIPTSAILRRHPSSSPPVRRSKSVVRKLDSGRRIPSRMEFAERYRIVETYRAGGEGEVHLVEDLREAARRKVLKVYPPGGGATEFEALRGLDHPGLASILECGTDRGRPYLTREFAEGGDLNSVVPLGPREATAVIVEVARALGYLHSRGVVHLDLKPGNVLRVRSDAPTPVKLADFGLASRAGEAASGGTL